MLNFDKEYTSHGTTFTVGQAHNNKWYWSTDKDESKPFNTPVEAYFDGMAYGKRLADDLMLAEEIERQEEQENAEYCDYVRQNRLSGRQLGVK